MSLGERLRNWFGRDDEAEPPSNAIVSAHEEPERTEESSTSPSSPLPSPAKNVTTDEAAEALQVAQGQELLGPCKECGGYWTRELTRGQKPLTCPVCKREGPPS